MKNALVAEIFRSIAQILQIRGDNRFRIRAYERAAANVEGYAEDIESVARQGRLQEIPGIGEDLSEKIEEIVRSGKLKFLDELKREIPSGVLDLLSVPTVGPKTAQILYRQLHIDSIAALRHAIEAHQLQALAGFKEKTIENIRKGVALVEKSRERMTLHQAIQVSEKFVSALKKLPRVEEIVCGGSLRRCKESVRDIDILIVSGNPQAVMDAFCALPMAKEILAHGQTKASVRTPAGVQVDCRVVEKKAFGAALVYFTGSKNFNIKLRMLAQKKKAKINEYGLFKGERFIAGRTEEELFKALGMQFVDPEIREDTGEIELALQGRLPRLVEHKDLKGDLHMHSAWSDGISSIEEMARSARSLGYSYIAVTDHSQGLKVANGLSPASLLKKRKEIDALNRRLRGVRVLFGAEVDIDAEGRLDYPDAILKEFEIVVGAIHSGFKQPAGQITRRLIRACENKYVHIIAHPTGRLIGSREAYAFDMEAVLRSAARTRTALEINSFPDRMDLNDTHCRMAKEAGVRISINTDSHAADQLTNIRYGLAMARRGWLEAADVLNTLPLDQLLQELK
ncbi:MAG TPA: DNA polymerase/3'-5' exonuclease PolX [Candidatus Omnitrophota bacterium]|nr:DNA polymerase/3'-5' exonuclease PolX [Candidatus Omnitrophota bacterium]HRZ14888.1 DNA polymerase/3'-5' exonuclease PolX [Candidatus Omnitrophota bacterium]